VKNKAQEWVFQSIKDVTASLPILGIDSDYADIGIAPTTEASSSTGSCSVGVSRKSCC